MTTKTPNLQSIFRVMGIGRSLLTLASLLQSQFFTAIAWATSNCLPAAPPKQKKGIREWGMRGGRSLWQW